MTPLLLARSHKFRFAVKLPFRIDSLLRVQLISRARAPPGAQQSTTTRRRAVQIKPIHWTKMRVVTIKRIKKGACDHEEEHHSGARRRL